MSKKYDLKAMSNEDLYAVFHDSRNKRFNPGLILLAQDEINRRWLKSWVIQPDPIHNNKKVINIEVV